MGYDGVTERHSNLKILETRFPSRIQHVVYELILPQIRRRRNIPKAA
jgi:hypothetical protein